MQNIYDELIERNAINLDSPDAEIRDAARDIDRRLRELRASADLD